MKIIDKLIMIHQAMAADPDGQAAFGDRLQKLSCMAVRKGMDSRAWSDYMKLFASNPDQLRRLCGEDEAFNETLYGLNSLAYMGGNGGCGIDTVGAPMPAGADARAVGTARFMTTEMIDGLDAGDLNSADDEAFLNQV
jgi:hypothetical protein